MASKLDDAERVHAEMAAEWRPGLEANAGTVDGAWLVSWRKATGRPAVTSAKADGA